VSLSLRRLRLVGYSTGASQRAVRLYPNDRCVGYHLAWLAYEAALDGRPQRAGGLVSDAGAQQLDRLHQTIIDAARAMLKVQTASRRERASALQEAFTLAAGDGNWRGLLAPEWARVNRRLRRDGGQSKEVPVAIGAVMLAIILYSTEELLGYVALNAILGALGFLEVRYLATRVGREKSDV